MKKILSNTCTRKKGYSMRNDIMLGNENVAHSGKGYCTPWNIRIATYYTATMKYTLLIWKTL